MSEWDGYLQNRGGDPTYAQACADMDTKLADMNRQITADQLRDLVLQSLRDEIAQLRAENARLRANQ